jgi:hypothetical protein
VHLFDGLVDLLDNSCFPANLECVAVKTAASADRGSHPGSFSGRPVLLVWWCSSRVSQAKRYYRLVTEYLGNESVVLFPPAARVAVVLCGVAGAAPCNPYRGWED